MALDVQVLSHTTLIFGSIYFDNVTFDCKHSPLLTKPSVIASGAKQSPAFNAQATVGDCFVTSFLAMTRKCDIVQLLSAELKLDLVL